MSGLSAFRGSIKRGPSCTPSYSRFLLASIDSTLSFIPSQWPLQANPMPQLQQTAYQKLPRTVTIVRWTRKMYWRRCG